MPRRAPSPPFEGLASSWLQWPLGVLALWQLCVAASPLWLERLRRDRLLADCSAWSFAETAGLLGSLIKQSHSVPSLCPVRRSLWLPESTQAVFEMSFCCRSELARAVFELCSCVCAEELHLASKKAVLWTYVPVMVRWALLASGRLKDRDRAAG